MDELGRSLRAWRDRLTAAEVGLPESALRRAPGLRREELAQLAGVSVDYLSRLEQGRAVNPSPQVLGALARALRLDATEEEHLFRAAGHVAPGRMRREVTPGVQRVLDRLTDVPVTVIDAAWTVIDRNPLATAVLGEVGEERNIIARHFAGAPSRFAHGPEEIAALEQEMVADLRAALARHPRDRELRALIDDLRASSERFDHLWETQPAAVRAASRKTLHHPELGRITLDCDVLTVHGSDLRLIVYTADPDSADAEALERAKRPSLSASGSLR